MTTIVDTPDIEWLEYKAAGTGWETVYRMTEDDEVKEFRVKVEEVTD